MLLFFPQESMAEIYGQIKVSSSILLLIFELILTLHLSINWVEWMKLKKMFIVTA